MASLLLSTHPYKITSIDLNSRHSRVLVASGVLRLIDFDRGVSIPEDDQFLAFSVDLCQAEHVFIEFANRFQILDWMFTAKSLSLYMLTYLQLSRAWGCWIPLDDAGSWMTNTIKSRKVEIRFHHVPSSPWRLLDDFDLCRTVTPTKPPYLG